MNGLQFLPGDAEQQLLALLKRALSGTIDDSAIRSIGDQDINDNDELVLTAPCVRTRFIKTQYADLGDNQHLAYDCDHIFDIWCMDENLASKEEQRQATMTLVHLILPLLAGARIALSDGTRSEPVRLIGISGFPEDIVGTIYIISVAVPGIAQFPGANV